MQNKDYIQLEKSVFRALTLPALAICGRGPDGSYWAVMGGTTSLLGQKSSSGNTLAYQMII